ncbi:MAG: hypothetical protein Q8S73_41765 [Deltaproteobacteria bacterium]|nr:hypothetical protein [Myxococcales bacterium]MDP3220688.1 hypothetical protein [Deltaproteobacteria bacterium]
MPTARPWRRPLWLAMIAASLVSACATGDGEPDDPDVKLIPLDELQPGEDTPAAEDAGIETDVPAEDVPIEPMDVGFDVGFDVGRDAGTDVGFDVGRDTGVDVGVDVGRDTGTDAGCVGPTSQTCGACGTQTRTCVAGAWTAWGTCVEPSITLAASWRLGITPVDGGPLVTSLAWFTGGGAAGALTGGAVDAYGYAELTSVATNGCARTVAFTKRYVVGSSTGTTFRYTGAWSAAPTSFAGTWVDTAAASNTSSFTAQSRSGRDPAAVAGSWRLAVTWMVTRTTFTIGPTGGLTGTMVDEYGTASLQGAVDLGSGAVMFVKRYTIGTSLDQTFLYTGTFSADGARITGGAWSDQGTSGLTGTWSAQR